MQCTKMLEVWKIPRRFVSLLPTAQVVLLLLLLSSQSQSVRPTEGENAVDDPAVPSRESVEGQLQNSSGVPDENNIQERSVQPPPLKLPPKQAISTEKILIKKLLERYERQGRVGRPVIHTNDNLTVYFGLSLIQILDVDETNQVLKTNIWYHYKWTDVLLSWNRTEHDDIDNVRVPSKKIWLPDILLYNFADDRLQEQRDALVVVYDSGELLWMPQAILRSSCLFDTLYFPFDSQQCSLKFGSWTYNGAKLNIDFVAEHDMDVSDFVPSNEWDIVENKAVRNVKYYTCCPEPYPDLTFSLKLKRKVAFYTFILVLPCALLSLLTLVIFWVPPESPAKLQLGMSIFVAFFFLLLVLAESTPRAAASVPLIGAYFCLSMVLITVSTVLACIVANMFFRGVRINRAPKWLRSCTIRGIATLLCLRDKIIDPEENMETKKESSKSYKDTKNKFPEADFKFSKVRLLDNGIDYRVTPQTEGSDLDAFLDRGGFRSGAILEEVRGIRDILEKNEEKKRARDERERYIREWRVIACVTDRFFFLIYVIINIVGITVIFKGQ
ncbi:neuronal acetylcholine receptor subunit beta-3-like [Haliotis rubra]|uniref:neuronal acetylcholine receptor subunit beta-3-like n=1 Tax=Haliotis rubra TaxID=36100 RepID=UPI001EE5D017|nr:neuronal acetylcholine receptor subunit beta-3-like [Haliotis rubra]XP_046582870.1 neuronal acetylcholine receptor subunit beta-3-like [Haliotis rubra]XP_046582871.1 neuronal acetylcholine receptor subunit beta-3-like [Haliotis rubra]